LNPHLSSMIGYLLETGCRTTNQQQLSKKTSQSVATL
jgi:hypothetical protein